MYVETIEVVDGILGVKNILVNDKGCAFFLRSLALSNLSDGTKSTKHVVQFFWCDFVWQVPYEYDFVDISWEPDIFCFVLRHFLNEKLNIYMSSIDLDKIVNYKLGCLSSHGDYIAYCSDSGKGMQIVLVRLVPQKPIYQTFDCSEESVR